MTSIIDRYTDYKHRDTLLILRYLRQHPAGISVDDIILHSGADKLRVYPALFELEQDGQLEVLEREMLGRRYRFER